MSKTQSVIHVQLGQELRERISKVTAKDPIITNDAIFIRTAAVALCDKWDRDQAEKESVLTRKKG